MNIAGMGMIGAVTGAPLAQAKGETERTAAAAREAESTAQGEQRADDAAGIAAADSEEKQTAERDADGRRPWEFPGGRAKSTEAVATDDPPPDAARQSRDATGHCGTQLDLTA